MNAPKREPIWIETPVDLRNMVRAIETCDQLAVDTESNSLYAYKEQVCLIQFSSSEADYLVDPLAIKDLSILGPIFATAEIEKIFHAAEYDVICLKRDFGFAFNNIFDTMLAARILGYEQIGLAAMLESEFDVVLDKHFQRANWGKRPLPKEQLDYARLDTHYLIPLRRRLAERLKSKQLFRLAEEDFIRLTRVEASSPENGMSHFWRLAGKEELSSSQLGVLFALYTYREDFARLRNRPVFKVISDRVLLDIAAKAPRTMDALGKIRGMNRNQLKQHGERLLEAVEKGLKIKPPQRPPRHHPNGHYLMLNDALRNWRKETARQVGVESDIVLPRDVLEEIARREPQSLDELKEVMHELPWRFSQYGKRIMNLIRRMEET